MPAFDVKIVRTQQGPKFVTCHPMGERRPTDVTFAPDPRTPRVPKYADLETHDNSLISYALGLFLIVLLTASAFAQKNMYEAKWGSQGNGGGDGVVPLFQAINQPQTCVGQTNICVSGAHGALHIADFGTGPFLIDDEGYVFNFPIWSSEIVRPEFDVRTFANGVH